MASRLIVAGSGTVARPSMGAARPVLPNGAELLAAISKMNVSCALAVQPGRALVASFTPYSMPAVAAKPWLFSGKPSLSTRWGWMTLGSGAAEALVGEAR